MKNEKKYILGIDTSNYTTSAALLSLDGELIANIKYPLKVNEGERGLRQSDAVFLHTKNIPCAMRDIASHLIESAPIAIGVSERPRNIDGSYMPCFLSGVAAAESISAAANIPIYKFSHQCGHIMAALYSSKREDLLEKEFCAFHISGGTTEMLKVHPRGSAFFAELIGGSADLNAGQVIDRIGVKMGIAFPCGAEMEKSALSFTGTIPSKKPSVKGLEFTLWGLENMALNLYEKTNDPALVSAFVFDYVANSISSIVNKYQETDKNAAFVFAGGVMSNSIIKAKLKSICDASFAEPALSADNAVGIAALTLRAYKSEHNL